MSKLISKYGSSIIILICILGCFLELTALVRLCLFRQGLVESKAASKAQDNPSKAPSFRKPHLKNKPEQTKILKKSANIPM